MALQDAPVTLVVRRQLEFGDAVRAIRRAAKREAA
jgi:hypothetical protein